MKNKKHRSFNLTLINWTIKCVIPVTVTIIMFFLLTCWTGNKPRSKNAMEIRNTKSPGIKSEVNVNSTCPDNTIEKLIWAKHERPKGSWIKFSNIKPPCYTNEWRIIDIRNHFKCGKDNFGCNDTVWTENKADVFRINKVEKMWLQNKNRIIKIGEETFKIQSKNGCTFEGKLSNYNPEVYRDYLDSLKKSKNECNCEIK